MKNSWKIIIAIIIFILIGVTGFLAYKLVKNNKEHNYYTTNYKKLSKNKEALVKKVDSLKTVINSLNKEIKKQQDTTNFYKKKSSDCEKDFKAFSNKVAKKKDRANKAWIRYKKKRGREEAERKKREEELKARLDSLQSAKAQPESKVKPKVKPKVIKQSSKTKKSTPKPKFGKDKFTKYGVDKKTHTYTKYGRK